MDSSNAGCGAADAEPLLAIEDLAVTFATDQGGVDVVQALNLCVRAGETVGLVGESGSGKTVTALSMMGLLPRNGSITAGRIMLDGTDLVTLSEAGMRAVRGRQIGMIFQEPRRSLDPCFSVGHQVAEAIRSHERLSRRDAWKRAVEMLDRVQLPNAARRAHDYPHHFSGGQCQRVMLAIALACSPRVLIADEPTTALDVTVQEAMLRLIGDLQREMELGVVMVTHDLGVVAETCDRVTVMYAGQVVEEATAVELFETPFHPYSSGLLRSISHSTKRQTQLYAVPGVVPAPFEWPSGCRFAPRCEHVSERCQQNAIEQTDLGHRSARCILIEPLVGARRDT